MSDSRADGAPPCEEQLRLEDDDGRNQNWTRWGPYLSERQWGTVREDYSADGSCWDYFPHDHARSRAYRWGEDGLFGITDRECRLCFALALWNGKDAILKERLFGLTNSEGNHGEDVKELYYFLDATPSASYLKGLYKYPQAAFPYRELVAENHRRGRADREYELEDTGVLQESRYFDITVEYAKASPDDILVRITCSNLGPDAASLQLLPTVWQRNTWAWGRSGEGYWPKGRMWSEDAASIRMEHPSLGRFRLAAEPVAGVPPRFIFTNNETNMARIYGAASASPFVKDAFHRLLVDGEENAVNPAREGTKASAWYDLNVPAGAEVVVRLRLTSEGELASAPFDSAFDTMFATRIAEATHYHELQRPAPLTVEERNVVRQSDAGLLWSKQFYHYIVDHWLAGDPAQPAPPAQRKEGRNRKWNQLWARDVIAMPDTWEYPWFASWDLAFHCVAMARIDPNFAKRQILLLCREWYMQPDGQIPAYEFAFGDVNPPVHAWAAWRLYQLSGGSSKDRSFLERAFLKCLVNFTWWVNREDIEGDNLFAGGFLGLDNIGVFDRSRGVPGGGRLEQADATAWMAFYSSTMLAIALELTREDPKYADFALKFFEHFLAIADAINHLGGAGLWDEQDGFYYDQAVLDGVPTPLRVRSMVGLVPLFAAECLDDDQLQKLPLFQERMDWLLTNRPELARNMALLRVDESSTRRLLAIPTREHLVRVLHYLLDENEFLSPFGIRSLSRVHLERPFVLRMEGEERNVRYAPGESDTDVFGGNSNWRGPVWFPVNYLLTEALKRYHHFYQDTLLVECPTGSGKRMNLLEVAGEIERRLVRLFLRDSDGKRPFQAGASYVADAHFDDLLLFHEHFDGDTGRGLGASHQTGWTALAGNLLELVAQARAALNEQ